MSDNELGCGPVIFLCLVVFVLAFGLGTCFPAASNGKATLEDRCASICRQEHSVTDSWSDRTHICVCDNGHVAHIRTQSTVLQTGTREDAGTR